MGEIARSPYTIVGQSDAGAHVQFISNFGVWTTLLGHYVRERRLLSLEEAVRQLTFKVASVFGIRDRGLVWPGWAGDLVLFDSDTVESGDVEEADDYPGGFTRVLQRARGVHYTTVGGEVLIERGEHTGAFPGRIKTACAPRSKRPWRDGSKRTATGVRGVIEPPTPPKLTRCEHLF